MMLGISGNNQDISQPLQDEEARAIRRSNRRRSTRRSIRKAVKSVLISTERSAAATSQLLVGDDFSVGEEDMPAEQEDKSQIKRQMSFSDLQPRVAVHVSLSDVADSDAIPTTTATPERRSLLNPSIDLMRILDDGIPEGELPKKTQLRRPSMSGLEQMRQLGGEMGPKAINDDDDEYSLQDLDSSSCGSSTFNLDDEQAMALQLSFHAGAHDLSQRHDQHVLVDRIPFTVVASPMGDAMGSEEMHSCRVQALMCPPTENKSTKILKTKQIATSAVEPFAHSKGAQASDGDPRFTKEEFETTLPVLMRRSSTSERARKPLNRKRSSLGKEGKKKKSTERRRSSRIAPGPRSSEVALGASIHSIPRKETSSRSTRSIPAQHLKQRPPRMNSRSTEAGNDCTSAKDPSFSRRERRASKRPTSSSRRQPTRSTSSDSPDKFFLDNPTIGEGRSSSKCKRVPSKARCSRDKLRRSISSDGGPDVTSKRNIVRRSVSAMDANTAGQKARSTQMERSSRRSTRRPSSRRPPSTTLPVTRATPSSISAPAKKEEGTEDDNLVSRLTRTLSKSRRESDPSQFMNTGIVTPRQRRQSYTYTPLSKKQGANSVAMVRHFQLALAIGID